MGGSGFPCRLAVLVHYRAYVDRPFPVSTPFRGFWDSVPACSFRIDLPPAFPKCAHTKPLVRYLFQPPFFFFFCMRFLLFSTAGQVRPRVADVFLAVHLCWCVQSLSYFPCVVFQGSAAVLLAPAPCCMFGDLKFPAWSCFAGSPAWHGQVDQASLKPPVACTLLFVLAMSPFAVFEGSSLLDSWKGNVGSFYHLCLS